MQCHFCAKLIRTLCRLWIPTDTKSATEGRKRMVKLIVWRILWPLVLAWRTRE